MQLRAVVPQPVSAMLAKFRGIGGLLLACLAVQLAYWLAINPVLFASPRRDIGCRAPAADAQYARRD